MQIIKFGTDGWRGRIADDYTFANVRRAAQGFASYILTTARPGEALIRGSRVRGIGGGRARGAEVPQGDLCFSPTGSPGMVTLVRAGHLDFRAPG